MNSATGLQPQLGAGLAGCIDYYNYYFTLHVLLTHFSSVENIFDKTLCQGGKVQCDYCTLHLLRAHFSSVEDIFDNTGCQGGKVH